MTERCGRLDTCNAVINGNSSSAFFMRPPEVIQFEDMISVFLVHRSAHHDKTEDFDERYHVSLKFGKYSWSVNLVTATPGGLG